MYFYVIIIDVFVHDVSICIYLYVHICFDTCGEESGLRGQGVCVFVSLKNEI